MFKCDCCYRAANTHRSGLQPKDNYAKGTASFRSDGATAHANGAMHALCDAFCRNADTAADLALRAGSLPVEATPDEKLLLPLIDNVLAIVDQCESLSTSFPARVQADQRKYGDVVPQSKRYLDPSAALDILHSACEVITKMTDDALDQFNVRLKAPRSLTLPLSDSSAV